MLEDPEMKPHPGLCKEYRKRVAGDFSTTLDLWEAVLILSIEDHPLYGHAEYYWVVGHPHGYSSGGLSDRIDDYIKIPTPSDRFWMPGPAYDLKKNGFPEEPNKIHNRVNIRWQPKVAN